MQPKRILISLLVVILALLSAGTVVSAEDGTVLDMAVEVSSSTALSDNVCIVTEDDTVTVSVTIKSNPGVVLAHFDVLYNPTYLSPVINADNTLKWSSSELLPSTVTETVSINHNDGKVGYTAYSSAGNFNTTGKIFTCSFNVLKHGNAEIKLDMKTNDVIYIKADGSWSEEGVDKVNISYNGSATATAVPVKIHTLGDTFTTVPADCLNGGQKIYTCTVCSEKVSLGDGTVALGHKPVVVPSVPVSCMQDGLTEGSKCSVCDAVIMPQLVAVEKSDEHHTVVTDPAVAPTCSKVGYTEGSHCSTCNEVFVKQNEVAKIAHTYGEFVPAEKGYQAKTCSVCGDKVTEALPADNSLFLIVITAVVTAVVVAGAAVVTIVVLKKKKVV